MTTRPIAAALAAVFLLSAAPAPAADDVATAQRTVFETAHLDNLERPTTLHYEFRRGGRLLPALVDSADLDVIEIHPDGRKQVAFRLFSGDDERRFAPRQGYRNNPMIIAFLQRDVEQMGRMTGGSPHYFRNRIREAFRQNRAVETEATTVEVDGRALEGTRVTVVPFVGDPNATRFSGFEDKRYEFVMVPGVPGGVYRLRAVTPGEDGAPLLEETITYEGNGTDD